MDLVIVESPAKGRTIKNILGPKYKVLASFGHVRDLPQKEIGIDVKNDFEPKYIIPPKSRKTIKLLKEEIGKANNLYLATDYDREGEAIAWHILQVTGAKSPKRITFHEITKPAVLEAIKHPRTIDMDLVDAQQARRILDRIVGYRLSPFLWRKVAQGLSAGRVQSVAVRLIVEKEKEIKGFVPEEFWQVIVELNKKNSEDFFEAILIQKDEEKISKLSIKNKKEAEKIKNALQNAKYQVEDLKSEIKKRYPSPPFTTSTLQQEAARRFNFSAKRTMQIAQGLYEEGLITYMRTDSVSVSNLALNQAREVIKDKFGQSYLPEQTRFYKTKQVRAQEAHEAIRPTDLARFEILGDPDRVKLYDVIRKRMIASQMKEAEFVETKVDISAKTPKNNFIFQTTGNRVQFDGFLKIYGESEKEETLPKLAKSDALDLKKLHLNQQFTQPPARYTEGTLIKELEKRGIGRPSTYAPTLATIIDRGYIEKLQGKLLPKDIGVVVSDLLVEHFPEIVDYQFTSKMEDELDSIAEGKLRWQEVLDKFYQPFSKNLNLKIKEVEKSKLEEETDKKCPECGKNLKIKLGRFGKFLACSGFPDCKYTHPLIENHLDKSQGTEIAKKVSKESCPKCGKKLTFKEGKYGAFLACEGYPECKYTKNIEIEAKVKCPSCQGKIVQKRTRRGKIFWGCSNYPKCKTAFWDEPQNETCPKCKNYVTLNSKTGVKKCSQCDYSTK